MGTNPGDIQNGVLHQAGISGGIRLYRNIASMGI